MHTGHGTRRKARLVAIEELLLKYTNGYLNKILLLQLSLHHATAQARQCQYCCCQYCALYLIFPRGKDITFPRRARSIISSLIISNLNISPYFNPIISIIQMKLYSSKVTWLIIAPRENNTLVASKCSFEHLKLRSKSPACFLKTVW